MAHGFQLDPRDVLGVGAEASPEEVRAAYREKSKKHHPDQGGDEWAFRVVLRAYEILKSTTDLQPTGWPGASNGHARHPGAGTDPFAAIDPARVVEVDLLWFRFEGENLAERAAQDFEETSLSVCLIVAWPEVSQTDRVLKLPDAADILRTLIQSFENIQHATPVVASRSRIEDGRFVGWLSYPDVLRAQEASLALDQALKANNLAVKLTTRDVLVPRRHV